MEQLLRILSQLGIDQSIFYQFGLFLLLFLVLKWVLFDRLLFVLEIREAKTTKLENVAKAKLDEANRLAADYDAQIEACNHEAQKKLAENKRKIDQQQAVAIKNGEDSLAEGFAKEKAQLVEQMSVRREKVMRNVDELSSELVGKLSA